MAKNDSFTALFDLWQKAHCSEADIDYLGHNIPRDSFLPDGIICPEQFRQAKQKVLFIAKEANWFQADVNTSPTEATDTMFWHREVAFGNTDKTLFSSRLAMLANAIMTEDENRYSVIDKSHDVLKSVAVINLNKRGGYSYCVWDTLNRYVKTYQEYIREQIRMIHPDLIVCCGYDVKWLLDEYALASEDCRVIWVYHPSYFAISDVDYLTQLKRAMAGEIWSSTKEHNSKYTYKPQSKGIIFDTNKTYSKVSTMDMILGHKISAYNDKAHLIDSFHVDDYAFFSVKGTGIVAAGRIISDTEDTSYSDGLFEKYKVVEMIVPQTAQIPHGEESLHGLSWKEVENLLDKRFFKARTDKRPYLNTTECELLITELQKLYRKDCLDK